MRECFQNFDFKPQTLALINLADEICLEYRAQGLTLTLRQLYYQFVSRGYIENSIRSYKRLGSAVNDGRLAGLIDWDAIEDRTRELEKNAHWDSPANLLEDAADQFAFDKWLKQPRRVEVWIEKEALAGVVEGICTELDVPFFSCRGYVSQSEQKKAGDRIERHFNIDGQETTILHLGDHDPSGIDMTRDNRSRLEMFCRDPSIVEVIRIALNMNQIEEHKPFPNPAKLSDSRATDYVARFGYESWELDALEPRLMRDLIETHVLGLRDEGAWEDAVEQEEEVKNRLRELARTWE